MDLAGDVRPVGRRKPGAQKEEPGPHGLEQDLVQPGRAGGRGLSRQGGVAAARLAALARLVLLGVLGNSSSGRALLRP
eukprot:14849426-Alexandrium_andersonii.AAC.1